MEIQKAFHLVTIFYLAHTEYGRIDDNVMPKTLLFDSNDDIFEYCAHIVLVLHIIIYLIEIIMIYIAENISINHKSISCIFVSTFLNRRSRSQLPNYVSFVGARRYSVSRRRIRHYDHRCILRSTADRFCR